MSRFRRQPPPEPESERVVGDPRDAPTITAELNDGPLAGSAVEAETVEGRPPKTIDVAAPDGSTCRYCLERWTQTGPSAAYTFLYRV